jgi:thiol:disulfide interchange protein
MLYLSAAFIGGLLLNVSPCLLPVIALKILNFIKMGEGNPQGALYHGLLYSLGIILSFVLLGLATASIKLLGGVVIFGSWALTSAWFNGILGAIMAFIGTAYLGVFKSAQDKIGLLYKGQSSVVNWLYTLKAKLPYLYSFLFGVLTTALGSACCGPVLGYGMGLALKLTFWPIVLAFTAAGIGMALPYLFLSAFPKWVKFIPKSGPWVKWVKRIAGCAMLITASWFIWLAI